LIFDPLIPLPGIVGESVLYLGVLAIAVLSHVTAIQRFLRAGAMILQDK
jgi:hypothetical protein